MISYSFKSRNLKQAGVITFKKISLPFVEVAQDEKGMIKRFMDVLDQLQPDIVTGYNSSGFDVQVLHRPVPDDRGQVQHVQVRGGDEAGEPWDGHEGQGGGQGARDMYTVIKFISIVGASESILKLNSKTLKNVYEAISGDAKKVMVDKPNIWKMWDGGSADLEALATYNLDDSFALEKV